MNEFQEIQPILVEHRRQLHRIPEVGSCLPKTAAYVESQLTALGVPYQKSPVDSGIAAVIQGNGPGRCIAFRADMDALPVEEQTGLPFASQIPGCMHACGHDAHTAILLGTAQLLMQRRDQFSGTVKLLFQANEEACQGAKQMIADGFLEHPKVDALVSLHVGVMDPTLTSGQFGIFPNSIMASSDRFDIYVNGKGGHGSRPEDAVDPISVAAQIINALQCLISRETDSLDARVLSFCAIEGGSVYNVIPDSVRIKGTIRTLSTQTRNFIVKRMPEIAQGVASAMRAEANVVIEETTPVLENDPAMTAFVTESARAFLPDHLVVTRLTRATMGSEDAAYFHRYVPATYCFLSTSNPEKHTNIPHHNGHFDIDEDVLWEGTGLFVTTALRFLNAQPDPLQPAVHSESEYK